MNTYSKSTFRSNLLGSSIYKLPQIGHVLPFDDDLEVLPEEPLLVSEPQIQEFICSCLDQYPNSSDWAMKLWIEKAELKFGSLSVENKAFVRRTVVSEVEMVMSQSQSQTLFQSQSDCGKLPGLFDEDHESETTSASPFKANMASDSETESPNPLRYLPQTFAEHEATNPILKKKIGSSGSSSEEEFDGDNSSSESDGDINSVDSTKRRTVRSSTAELIDASSPSTADGNSYSSGQDIFESEVNMLDEDEHTPLKENLVRHHRRLKDKRLIRSQIDSEVVTDNSSSLSDVDTKLPIAGVESKEVVMPSVAKKTVVDGEIQKMKELERGPSEADLRRQKLIEIDEDVLEDRIIELRDQAMTQLKRAVGKSIKEQREKLRAVKDWIVGQLKSGDAEVLDWMEHELQLNQTRLVTSDEQEVDYQTFLRLPSDGDISTDEEESYARTQPPFIPLQSEGVIELSDDSEDDFDEDIPKGLASIAQPKSHILLPANNSLNPKDSVAMLARKVVPVLSARDALKQSLKKKVLVAAGDNLCQQMKITTTKLRLRTEITEKCRMLIDLLRERDERRHRIAKARAETERALRREMYLRNADRDDEEFDDDFGANERPMTEAERLAVLKQFEDENNSADEDEDDDEIEQESQDSIVGDDGSDDDDESETPENSDNDGEVQVSSSIDIPDNILLDSNELSTKSEGNEIGTYDNELDGQILSNNLLRKRNTSVVLDDYDTVNPVEPDTDIKSLENNAEDVMPAADEQVKEMGKKSRREKPRNSEYLRMLEAEERKYRSEKTKGKSELIEMEAEEEEEEGRQAGLGDFGFGGKFLNEDDEQDATKLRAGDLDNIVDSISDDEGDDVAAAQARMEQQLKEDREETKAVIQGITMGYDPTRRSGKKGKYNWDKLISGRDEEEVLGVGATSTAAGDEEFDEEEMIQQGLQRRSEMEKLAAEITNRRMFSDDSSSGDDSEDSEGVEDMDSWTEDAKKAHTLEINQRKEKNRLDRVRRREIARKAKMRRLLRHNPSLSQGNLLQASKTAFSFDDAEVDATYFVPSLNTKRAISPRMQSDSFPTGLELVSTSCQTMALTSESYNLKTGTNDPAVSEFDITNGNASPVEGLPAQVNDIGALTALPSELKLDSNLTIGELLRPNKKPYSPNHPISNKRRVEKQPKQFHRPTRIARSVTYSGALSHSDVALGFGMGMAVPSLQRRTLSDLKRTPSDSNLSSEQVGGQKRSLERKVSEVSSAKRRWGMTNSFGNTVTVASAQYIFTSTSSNIANDENSMNESSNFGGESNSRGPIGRGFARSSSTASVNRFGTSLEQGQSSTDSTLTSQLFKQLAAKNASSVRRSTSIVLNK